MTFDHFIAVDWAFSNMAIARLTKQSAKAEVIDVPASIKEFKLYLKKLRGRKILTFEETTTAQWLYVELKECVDELVVCDPYRNKLLSEGAKTDKSDASKLASLLRAGMLKPVFHSGDKLITLRKLVSGYQDVIQRGVRLKNQRSAILRGLGKDKKSTLEASYTAENFVLSGIDKAVEAYEEERKAYEAEFDRQIRAHQLLKYLKQIPGIGTIGAVKLGAAIVDGSRFESKRHFHSYAGLVLHDRISGNRSYGTKKPRYRRDVKCVFKTAALAAISGNNCFTAYYNYLVRECRYSDHTARHAVARKIATAAYAVMKHKKKFNIGELGALRNCQK